MSFDRAKCPQGKTDRPVAFDNLLPCQTNDPGPSLPIHNQKGQPAPKRISVKRKKAQQPTQQIKDVVSALKELQRQATSAPKLKAVRQCRQALRALIRTRWERDIAARQGGSAANTYVREINDFPQWMDQLESLVQQNGEAEIELIPRLLTSGADSETFRSDPLRQRGFEIAALTPTGSTLAVQGK